MKKRPEWSDYLLIIMGTLIMGFAIKNIYDPISLVTGGVSGIAIILKNTVGVPLWITNTALNIPLFILALKIKGWGFVKRTFIATLSLSVFLYAIPEIRILTEDLFLSALFGGIISGIGAGLVIRNNATTGGTDMLAAIIQRKLPHYSIVQITQVLDAVIVIVGISVFGLIYALYALIAIYTATKVSDSLIEGWKFSKQIFIISDKNEEIAAAIMDRMNRGVTSLDAVGMYSGNNKKLLYCVISKKEIVIIKEIIREFDSSAFVTVSDAREVLGEGFIEY